MFLDKSFCFGKENRNIPDHDSKILTKQTQKDQKRRNHSFSKGSKSDPSETGHTRFTTFGQTLKKNIKPLNTSIENQAERKTLRKKLEISTNLKIKEGLEPLEILEDFNQCENLQKNISKESLNEFEKV